MLISDKEGPLYVGLEHIAQLPRDASRPWTFLFGTQWMYICGGIHNT